jgi:hypothetical protein
MRIGGIADGASGHGIIDIFVEEVTGLQSNRKKRPGLTRASGSERALGVSTRRALDITTKG